MLGDRTFTGGIFTVSAGANDAVIGADQNRALLQNAPDGTVPLAIATVGYVTSQNVTASNGLTKTGSDITFGGGLTGSTALNISDFNLEFTTTTDGVGDISFGAVATRLDNFDIHSENGLNLNDTNAIGLTADTVGNKCCNWNYFDCFCYWCYCFRCTS